MHTWCVSKVSDNDFCGIKPKEIIPYNRFEKKCEIGNDVWIGTNSTILRGVTVGDGAAIGANSVVTKDIPPFAIAAGNPAKVIKFRFNEKIIEQILELRWWDFPLEVIKENYNLFNSKDIQTSIIKLKTINAR